MKVSGFSFVRNAVRFGYPLIESIKSVLPVCDEFILCLGNSNDNTDGLVSLIDSPKLKIIHSVWDDSLRKGGQILAVETNKAFDAIEQDSDWCFYIQADEILHEKYYEIVQKEMLKWKDNIAVEGLLFNYLHFYYTYDYIGDSRQWYRNEIRIIKNDKSIRSYKDAQGFRKNGNKLNVKKTNAFIYHYGWVKDPATMKQKEIDFNRLWHDDNWLKKNVTDSEFYDFSKIDSLKKFHDTHPAVMQKRINEMNLKIEFDISRKNFSAKNKLLFWLEKLTGYRLFEYKNFRII